MVLAESLQRVSIQGQRRVARWRLRRQCHPAACPRSFPRPRHGEPHAPAMLQYLDNAQNAGGHINENYARELMELHTLGVGSGYTQQDIQELARVLTGVGVNASGNEPKLKPEWQQLYRHDGAFEFNPARHDFGGKTLLENISTAVASAKSSRPSTCWCHSPRALNSSPASSPAISSPTIRRARLRTAWRRRSRKHMAISPRLWKQCSSRGNSPRPWA